MLSVLWFEVVFTIELVVCHVTCWFTVNLLHVATHTRIIFIRLVHVLCFHHVWQFIYYLHVRVATFVKWN